LGGLGGVVDGGSGLGEIGSQRSSFSGFGELQFPSGSIFPEVSLQSTTASFSHH
jgi:hypothetical protein